MYSLALTVLCAQSCNGGGFQGPQQFYYQRPQIFTYSTPATSWSPPAWSPTPWSNNYYSPGPWLSNYYSPGPYANGRNGVGLGVQVFGRPVFGIEGYRYGRPAWNGLSIGGQ